MLVRLLILFSQFLNVLCWGDEDEMLCSRAWRLKDERYWREFVFAVDYYSPFRWWRFPGQTHCQSCYTAESKRRGVVRRGSYPKTKTDALALFATFIWFASLIGVSLIALQHQAKQRDAKLLAGVTAPDLEFGRFRDRSNDREFSGPVDDNKRKRPIIDRDRTRLFDGTMLWNIGGGLLVVSVGLIALSSSISIVFAKIRNWTNGK